MSIPRLTKDQKNAICAAYESGEATKLIARRFGTDGSYPSLLAKRRGLKPRRQSVWMAQHAEARQRGPRSQQQIEAGRRLAEMRR